MVEKPFFSIVLPTYNQSSFLKNCINSILKQTYENWELLIINNNSTDNTLKIINQFNDKRIRVLEIQNSGILAKSRNLGIKNSLSKWICFVDTDDTWYPEKLNEIKKYIYNTKGDLFYHDLVFENKRFFFLIRKKIQDKSRTINKPILEYFALNGNAIGNSSVVIKKSLLKSLNYISTKKDNKEGQINETESISAGLDYPGISPLHCFLKDAKRARYTSATDEEALAAFQIVTKLEDISPSLEPSHAFAEAIKLAPKLNSSTVIIVNSCGDSLKDKFIIRKRLGVYKR